MRTISILKTVSLLLAAFFVLGFLSNKLLNISNERNYSVNTTKKPESIQSQPPGQIFVNDEKKSKNGTIYVLFSNELFEKYWGLSKETISKEDLSAIGCPQTNCVMTFKNDTLPHLHDYEAILFHIWDTDVTFPKTRSPRQLYIMVSKE